MRIPVCLLISIVLLTNLAVGCGESEDATPLRIGVLLVNSETQTENAMDRLRAAQLAIKHANDAGGVFGLPVEIAEGDTADPENEARRLIEQDGVHAIVGASSSAHSLLVIAIAAPAQVPVISPVASSPLLTTNEDDDFFFRTVLSDAAQGPALARLTRERGLTGSDSSTVMTPGDAD